MNGWYLKNIEQQCDWRRNVSFFHCSLRADRSLWWFSFRRSRSRDRYSSAENHVQSRGKTISSVLCSSFLLFLVQQQNSSDLTDRNMLGNNDGREITGWWTEFYTNKPKNHRHKISCFIWLFPSTTWQPMGINLWSCWGSWPPGWEPITKLGNFIKCVEVCGCDVTGSIIWIPLMFSRCCSGRREINTRRKNTFTSKEYEGGLDLPSYLSRSFSPSTSSLSRRSFVFYAPVTPLKTLQNTSWQTSPVSRGGRGRQVREEEDGENKKGI